MRRRRKREVADGTDDRKIGRVENVLLSFMGPAQIGEDKPREGYVPDPAASLCHKCGQPWEAHERVHTGTMTYRRCPISPAE